MYHGQSSKVEKHGKGKLTKANGDVYDGDFVSDKMHGERKVIYVDGEVIEGIWKNDQFEKDIESTPCSLTYFITSTFIFFIFFFIIKNAYVASFLIK